MSYIYSTIIATLFFLGFFSSFQSIHQNLECHQNITERNIYSALLKASDKSIDLNKTSQFNPQCLLNKKSLVLNIEGNLKNE